MGQQHSLPKCETLLQNVEQQADQGCHGLLWEALPIRIQGESNGGGASGRR